MVERRHMPDFFEKVKLPVHADIMHAKWSEHFGVPYIVSNDNILTFM